MIGKISGVISVFGIFFAIVCGNVDLLGGAVIDGAASAVKLTLALCGMTCLWCGIMNVFKEAGIVDMVSRLLTPVIYIFFPDTYKSGAGREEIAANIAANLLGIGNAATPLALSALEKMQLANPDPQKASRDMITLAVLNTCSVSLFPSTIITLLSAQGSKNPFVIIAPIWICSVSCSLLALICCRLLGQLSEKKRKRPGFENI